MVGKKRYRPEDDAQNQPQVKQGSKTDIHVASPYGCRVQACGELRLIRLVAQVRPSLGLTWVQESSFPSCAHRQWRIQAFPGFCGIVVLTDIRSELY